MIDWISVKDRFPKEPESNEYELYFVVADGEPDCAFYDGDAQWDNPYCGWLENVTHWAETNLPEEKK